MSANGKPTIDRIDHGVLPSNDLGRAHRFYSTFMGGEIDHLTNLTISRSQSRGAADCVLHAGQSQGLGRWRCRIFRSRPTPARPLEGVVYGFEVAADNLADVVRAAEERKVKIPRPGEYAAAMRRSKSRFLFSIPTATRWSFPFAAIRSSDKQQGKNRAAHAHQPRARGSD